MKVACGAMLLALALAGCAKRPVEADVINEPAKLSGALPYPVLQWKPITTSVNRGAGTMATLFGNDAAVAAARSGQAYPAGAVIALATWKQRDDPHWFGARIPAEPVRVETVAMNGAMAVYKSFSGSPLQEGAASDAAERMQAILTMKAALTP